MTLASNRQALFISYNYQNMKKTIVILLFTFSFPLFSQGEVNVLILQNDNVHDVDIKTKCFG